MTERMWNYFDKIVELKIADDVLYQKALQEYNDLVAQCKNFHNPEDKEKLLDLMKQRANPHWRMAKISARWMRIDDALEKVYNFIVEDKVKTI